MQLADPLRSYLKSVRQLTGATNVSLLLFPITESGAVEMLFHDGDMPPVPELSSIQAAERFLADKDSGKEKGEEPGAERLLRAFRSTDEGGCLLRICTQQITDSLNTDAHHGARDERRTYRSSTTVAERDESVWIGLHFAERVPTRLLEEIEGIEPAFVSGEPLPMANRLAWNLAFGIHMARQAHQLSGLLHDPVSRLPGRMEFQAHLSQALIEARRKRQPLGLALINPDDFGHINHRLGRESGDSALQELADQLEVVLRQSDVLFRYGGAVFGMVMQAASVEEANRAAERIRLTLSQVDLLKGAVRLTFSVGVVVYSAADQDDPHTDADELMRRADRALNAAKLSGGGRTVLWEPAGLASVVGNLDRLSGIFTADTEKDYRNMLLLWDTVTVITSHAQSQTIATEFVKRLGSTFKAKRLGLYEMTGDGENLLLAAFPDQPEVRGGLDDRAGFSLSQSQRELLDRVRQSSRTERLRLTTNDQTENAVNTSIAYAVPLLARGTYLGCLYIDGQAESFALDSSDMIFLGALANQVAMALDRAKLAMRWKQQKEQESRQLKEEVRGLRNALQHSRLIYRSPQMQTVLDVLRRIAPTDTTVLITGESGTGKEVLARTLHEQSQRHTQPFVTVDCGAIAQSLMEVELFGHVKGAFTGAQEASMGRIALADGGTLFLDEIGELPLEVQTKLLRFVQEKEFTPVGAANSRKVDVRIVAATNRDLAAESAAGTFRQDLYYRLQVVTLTSPPLRERPEDILPLAYYFLEKFAVQNDKSARRLSPEAEATLLRNSWTGNVRELQNRILQAVVMSDTEKIDWPELGLNEADTSGQFGVSRPVSTEPEQLLREPFNHSVTAYSHVEQPVPISLEVADNPMEALRRGLAHHVEMALRSGAAVPLGRWLISDLLLAADAAVNGVARRASVLLGMAETTFRRQLLKARQESLVGQSVRTPDWSALKPIFARIISTAREAPGQNLVDQVSQLLLEEVVAHAPHNDNLGSALLGVTKPTYQRRKTVLHG
jgi:diguanylate cyclase (GGDEF)-like protein